MNLRKRCLFLLFACLLVPACLRQFPAADLTPLALLGTGSSSGGSGDTASTASTSTYTLSVDVSNLTGTVVLLNNGGDAMTITADGTYSFPGEFFAGDGYDVTVQSVTAPQQCYVYSNNGSFSNANVSLTVQCFSPLSLGTAPTVQSTTPTDGSSNQPTCFGGNCRSRANFVFDETMDTTVTPALALAQIDGVTIPVTILGHAYFSTTNLNDSVTIELSWGHYPENSPILLRLNATSVRDTTATTMAANYDLNFTTTTGLFHVIADSGQTQCSDGATVSPCVHGAFGQDGDYSGLPRPRSFSAPDNSAFATQYVTRDNVTGLTWLTCPLIQDYDGAGNCTGIFRNDNWSAIFDECGTLNSMNAGAGYAGIRGWRMPTLREMRTMAAYHGSDPAWDTSAFAAGPAGFRYWTSSATAANSSTVYYWDSSNGNDATGAKGSNYGVRCVTGEGRFPNFVDNGDETVTDNNTGLTWMKCSFGQTGTFCGSGAAQAHNRDVALGNCESLTLAGRGDWRLPAVHELQSIVDLSSNPGPLINGLFRAESSLYLTSSYRAAVTVRVVDFGVNGTTGGTLQSTPQNYRCVTGP